MRADRTFSISRALALLWLGTLALAAGLAPYFPWGFQPADPDLAHIAAAPLAAGSRHWLGTDFQGRDVLANLVFGARTILFFTVPAAVLAALLGTLAGSAAGFWRNALPVSGPAWLGALGLLGWALSLPFAYLGLGLGALGLCWSLAAGYWRHSGRRVPAWSFPLDALVLGAAALLGTVPRLVLVVAVAGIGISSAGLLALLALTAWPDIARLVRAEMLRVRVLPFIDSARAGGLAPRRIWLRHALPHAVRPLRAALPLSIASLIGMESTLAFLGIGLPPTVPSWGRMLNAARMNLDAWWVALFPALLLILSIASLQRLARPERGKPH